MDRKKLIYIGLILILTVIVSITYFSYAFFTSKDEQSGKLNIVTGTLDYKIECNDLVNNSITLEAKEYKQIQVAITSLNKIDSKYELFYTTTGSNIEVGYGSNNATPAGIILATETKTLSIVIKNKSTSAATITFGIVGGFTNNSLVISNGNSITAIMNGICDYDIGYVWNFPFDPDGDGKGQVQEFSTPCDGKYKMEVWGAQGGRGYYGSQNATGGAGGYATGTYNLDVDAIVYIYVGGKGTDGAMPGTSNVRTTSAGGYNGGGVGYNYYPGEDFGCGGGGGATHMALVTGELRNLSSHATDGKILLVAGGGGGASLSWYQSGGYRSYAGGSAGGTSGGTGSSWSASYKAGTGGTQSAGGVGYAAGAFGLGGSGTTAGGAGGGSGYYGGGGSGTWASAGGGSSYIGGVNNGSTIAGSGSMPKYDGTGSMTGNAGNGYARITYLGD